MDMCKRLVPGAALLMLLSACSSDPVKDCSRLAGPKWTPMSHPPDNARELLRLEDLPNDTQLVWMSKPSGQLLACFYSGANLTNPSCSNSSAYAFEQKNGRWVANGQLLETCGRFDAVPEP